MKNFIELCQHIKRRPSMWLWPVKYYSAANLVIGYDVAMDELLLEGFREWIILKLGERCNWHWIRHIPLLVFPETPFLFEEWSEVKASPEQEKMAICRLFDELEEFYLVKKDRDKGLHWIYAQYDELCRKEDERIDREYDEEFGNESESMPCAYNVYNPENDEA